MFSCAPFYHQMAVYKGRGCAYQGYQHLTAKAAKRRKENLFGVRKFGVFVYSQGGGKGVKIPLSRCRCFALKKFNLDADYKEK